MWAALALFWSTEPPPLEIDPDRICEVRGWVRSSLRRLDDRVEFELQPERTLQGDREVRLPGRLVVRFRAPAEGIPRVYYGDRFELRSYLREPSYYAIPGVADRRENQWRRGVARQVDLKSFRQLVPMEGTRGCPLRRFLDGYRRRFVDYCSQNLSSETLQLVLAAFLGESTALEENRKASVRRLGVLHLFVVSGLHIGMLLVSLRRLMHPLRAPGKALALAGVWAYIGLVGASSSALRAGLMSSYACALEAFGTRGRMLNHLGIAGLVLLAANPSSYRSPGLQFSFLSLLALGLGSSTIDRVRYVVEQGTRLGDDRADPGRATRRTQARRLRFALESWCDPVRSPRLARLTRLLGRALAPVVVLALASLAIQIATVPLSLYYSNQWAWMQCFSNLLLIPLFGLLMPGCFLLLALFWTPLGPVARTFVEAVARLIEWAIEFQARGALITWLPQPSGLEVLAYFVFLLVALLLRGRWRVMLLAPPLLLFAVLRTATPFAHQKLIVTMLDVGQGESLHLSYPDSRSALVDTGGLGIPGAEWTDFVGERLVSRYLRSLRIPELQFILLSHPHLDHIQGFSFVGKTFPVGCLYHSEPHDSYAEASRLELSVGDHFTIGGVHHLILHLSDPAPTPGWDVNNGSLVAVLRYGHFSLLLTGDIEARAEQVLAPGLDRVTVLKVAHHGSRTSSSKVFLETTRPRIALVSAGRRNRFGHPFPETRQRLDEEGSRVLLTSELGSVRVETDGWCWRASHFSMETRRFEELFSECAGY